MNRLNSLFTPQSQANDLKTEQPILGKTGTLFFLVLMSAFPPLTTDLYLPALPQMVEVFDTTQAMVNLTLTVYFVTYAIGLLFWGPLSEMYGRRPIMLMGAAFYSCGGILCFLASDIELLISARVIQAFGGSAITVVTTAIVKDLYDGIEREKIMASIMSLVVVAPMVAPSLGSLLLHVSSWRMIFMTLALFGCISAVLALCYKETLESRYTGSVLRSWGRLIVVLRNPKFLFLLGIFSLTPMAMMGFVAASSYIYVEQFGLTESQFSIAFGLNALFASLGPRIYIQLLKRINKHSIIRFCFLMISVCGCLNYYFAHESVILFAVITAFATMAMITTRVPGTNILLEQQQKDTGSAVALIQFFGMTCGATGMFLVSIPTDSLIRSLATVQILVGVICIILWSIARSTCFVQQQEAHQLD